MIYGLVLLISAAASTALGYMLSEYMPTPKVRWLAMAFFAVAIVGTGFNVWWSVR